MIIFLFFQFLHFFELIFLDKNQIFVDFEAELEYIRVLEDLFHAFYDKATTNNYQKNLDGQPLPKLDRLI